MAAARYWRFVGIRTWAAGALQLSAVVLHTMDGAVSATPSASHAPVGGTLGALTDVDPSTLCTFAAEAVRSGGFWLAWDLGADVEIIGAQFGAGDVSDTFVDTVDLQYSSDGRTWTAASTTGRYPWPGARQLTAPPAADAVPPGTRALVLMRQGATEVTQGLPVALNGAAALDSQETLYGQTTLKLSGGYMTVGSTSDLHFGQQPFTAAAWFKVTGTAGDAALFSRRSSMTVCPFELRVNNSGAMHMFASGSWGTQFFSGRSMPLNKWCFIALVGDGQAVRLSVDGKFGSGSISQGLLSGSDPEPFIVGRGGDGVMYGWCGDILVADRALYTADFDPPTGFGGFTVPREPRPLGVSRLATSVLAGVAVPPFNLRAGAACGAVQDVQFGGAGRIWGTTKTKASPVNVPTKARVVLLHQRSKIAVRETWSDPTTGDFAFVGIDTRQQFLTLAEDVDGNFRPVAASRLVPEVQP